MRVRLFELRLLAVILFALWSGAFALVLVGYRPGGPLDLVVGAIAALPAVVAGVAVIWPPLARGPRAAVAIGWLGIVAALLLIPSVAGLVAALRAGPGAQTLLPAPEVAYANILALFATCLFCGLGLARAMLGATSLRRPRLFLGTLLALAMTSLIGTAFGGATLANELILAGRSLPPSAWGPVGPNAVPPTCDGPLAIGPFAALSETGTAVVPPERKVGQVSLSGARNGTDERWAATVLLGGRESDRAYARVGSSAWLKLDDGPWTRVSTTATQVGPSAALDGAVVAAALTAPQRVAAEDVGLELVGGARARHCRTATTGTIAVAAFPVLGWLAGGPTLGPSDGLAAWRGNIDWWVFGDGQLGLATVRLTGLPPSSWGSSDVLGVLQARLTATERDVPQAVTAVGP